MCALPDRSPATRRPCRTPSSRFSDGESDSEADAALEDEFAAAFQLRNAVAIGAGGGRPRALTRASALFAAHFASLLLRERGFVLARGDAEEMLSQWLELPGDAVPSEALWRQLGDVE